MFLCHCVSDIYLEDQKFSIHDYVSSKCNSFRTGGFCALSLSLKTNTYVPSREMADFTPLTLTEVRKQVWRLHNLHFIDNDVKYTKDKFLQGMQSTKHNPTEKLLQTH